MNYFSLFHRGLPITQRQNAFELFVSLASFTLNVFVQISLDEYLCYIDIMLYGSDEEKRKQSFGLLDKRGEGRITFDDFKSIVQSFA